MRYFIVSDIHSCYRPLEKALTDKGFDLNNPEHVLVVLGDTFDRGTDTRKIYDLLANTIPQDRVILVRGNHESLFIDLLQKKFPDGHDFTNGTVSTFVQIVYKTTKTIDKYNNILINGYNNIISRWNNKDYDKNAIDIAIKTWRQIANKVRKSDIYKWIASDKWQNYWETDKFIGVHSFIPIKPLDDYDPMYLVYNGLYGLMEYDPDWRNPKANWDAATWGCPYEQFDYGLFKPEADKGKTLIVGHWHCRKFNEHYVLSNKRLKTKMSNEYTPSYQDVLDLAVNCPTGPEVINQKYKDWLSQQKMIVFNEIKSIMRFINNAAEEIVIRKNKIYSKKTNEVLAEYQSKK